MKTKVLFIAFVLLTSVDFAAAQQNNGREVGINIRDAWFGSSAHILHRRQKEANRWRRFDLSVSPTYSSSRTADELNGIAVPNEFRFQSTGNFVLNYKNVNERYRPIVEDLSFYYGPTWGAQYNHQRQKRTFAAGGSIIRNTSDLNQTATFRLGYVFGIKYVTKKRLSFGADIFPHFYFQANMYNQDVKEYDSTTRLMSDGNNVENQVNTSIGFTGAPIMDLWLFYRLGN